MTGADLAQRQATHVTMSACAPVLPDCPATTGNNTASAVNCAIVPNRPTTAARNAVARLMWSLAIACARQKTPWTGRARPAHTDHGLQSDGRLILGRHQVAVADHANQALSASTRQVGEPVLPRISTTSRAAPAR